jgi:molybdopterin molybdotransferase
MISVAEALAAILARSAPLAPIEVDFQDALGMVLAADIVSREDLPTSPRSAVDGYAVRALPGPDSLRVLGELTAGQVSTMTVEPGTALRIMTGGLLPPGAEAVVMVEDTSEQDGVVEIKRGIGAGDNVQPTGLDLRQGQTVLTAGQRLGSADIGMLASVGQTRVPVYPRPRVAVLATGDELVEPDQDPPEGSLRDSSRFALIAAAREAGGEIVWQGSGRDDRAVLEGLVREALKGVDVLITSGGVSMGTRDLIKPILAELGDVQFGRIAFKPGKPLTFVTAGRALIFGLPGYPVSSLVTFEIFVRPALLQLQGLRRVLRPRVEVELQHAVQPDRSRLEYQRAVVTWENGRLVAASTGIQSSSRLASMVGANGLLEVEPGDTPLAAGSRLPALITGDLLD